MMGVDKNDQVCCIRKDQKQLKWYMRLSIKLLIIAVYNAYHIEDATIKPHRSADGKTVRSLLTFKEELIRDMIGDIGTPPEALKWRRSYGSATANEELRLSNVSVHLPEKGEGHQHTCLVCMQKIKRWVAANRGHEDRPCPRGNRPPRTSFQCISCKEYFCTMQERNCFIDYHTKLQ